MLITFFVYFVTPEWLFARFENGRRLTKYQTSLFVSNVPFGIFPSLSGNSYFDHTQRAFFVSTI